MIKQMRLVVQASDYENAVAFYRDALGMPELESYSGRGGAKVMILDAGRATLELSNPAQIEFIDEVEVGERVAPHLRVAFEVADSRSGPGSRSKPEPSSSPDRSPTGRCRRAR